MKTWFSYEIDKVIDADEGYIVYPHRPNVMYYFVNKRYAVEPKVGDIISELRADESIDTHYGLALNGVEIKYHA